MRGGGGGQSGSDQTAGFFWIICMVMGSAILVWIFGRQLFVAPVFWLKLVEINVIKSIVLAWSKIAISVHLPVPDTHILDRLQKYISSANPKIVPFNYFSQINWYVGLWLRFPVMVILTLLATFVYFRHNSARFRKSHNMDTLKKQEVKNWPQINPVIPLNLIKEDIEKGPWAMAKTPFDFCKENNLIMVKNVDGKPNWSLMRGPAYRIFALQVGPLWRGAKNLPIHIKALLIICVARAEKNKDVAKQLLKQIAASASSGQLDFTGVEELLIKYQGSALVQWLEKRHAYIYTLMASVLEIARVDGVLASSEFLWLKPLDRRLWYVLNNVGRQTAFVECAGPQAHWLAEKKVGQPLKTPMVKEAVNGLEQTINETLYIAEGDRWHTNNVA